MSVTRDDIEKAAEVARSYGATRLVLFGRAQHEPRKARDLDLAVAGVEGWNVWRLAGDMADALPVPLDLIPLELDNAFTRRVEERGEVLFESPGAGSA